MTLAGYMPDVLACAGCGKYDGGEFYLDPVEGRLLCADCAEKAHHITNLDNGALYALRHICLAEDKKLFGFKISPESLQELSRTSEQYTLAHLEHPTHLSLSIITWCCLISLLPFVKVH